MGRLARKRRLKACDPASRRNYPPQQEGNDDPYASSDADEGAMARPPPGGWPSDAPTKAVRRRKRAGGAAEAAELPEPVPVPLAPVSAGVLQLDDRAVKQAARAAKRLKGANKGAGSALPAAVAAAGAERPAGGMARRPDETLREFEKRVKDAQRGVLIDHLKGGTKAAAKRKSFLKEKKAKKRREREQRREQALAQRDRRVDDTLDEFPDAPRPGLMETNASVPQLTVRPRKARVKSALEQSEERQLAVAREQAQAAYKALKARRARTGGGGGARG